MAHQRNPFQNGGANYCSNMISISAAGNWEVDTKHTKIFVGGLAWETRREALKRYFEQFGETLEAVVINDKYTGRSKGYGFVTFRDPDAAQRACAYPEPIIDGRKANCNLAFIGAAGGGLRPPHAQYVVNSPQQQPARVRRPQLVPDACVYIPPPPSNYNPFPYYGYYGSYSQEGMYPMQGYYGLAGGSGQQQLQHQIRYPTGLITTAPSSTVYPYCAYPRATAIGVQYPPERQQYPSSSTLFPQQQQFSNVIGYYSTSCTTTTTATHAPPASTSVVTISSPKRNAAE